MGLVGSNWNITPLHPCIRDALTAGTAEWQMLIPAFNPYGFILVVKPQK